MSPFNYDSIIYGFPFTNTLKLCGGMCFASHDYFNLPKSIPPQPDKSLTQEMRDRARGYYLLYLGLRQAASLLGVFRKLNNCITYDTERIKITNTDFQTLKTNLSPANPRVLCLIKTLAKEEAYNNHQVLAYSIIRPLTIQQGGYNWKKWQIKAYDPSQSRSSGMIISVITDLSDQIAWPSQTPFTGWPLALDTLWVTTRLDFFGFFINFSYTPGVFMPPPLSIP